MTDLSDLPMDVLGSAGGPLTTTVHKTLIHLADGRELFYFDEAPTDRSAPDTRDLRRDHHQQRDPAGPDPRRVDGGGLAPAVADLPAAGRRVPARPVQSRPADRDPGPSYDVVVFENRFPSLAQGSEAADDPAPALFVSRAGQRPL